MLVSDNISSYLKLSSLAEENGPSNSIDNPWCLKTKSLESTYIAYSVVPRVEPVLEDLSDEFRREEGRLKDRRDPREVGLLVPFESTGVSDSYDVRLRVIGGDLSARAEK